MEKIQLSIIPRGLYIELVTSVWRMFSVVLKIVENSIVCVCWDEMVHVSYVMLCFVIFSHGYYRYHYYTHNFEDFCAWSSEHLRF